MLEDIRNMDDILTRAKSRGPAVCVIAGAYGEGEIKAGLMARDEGLINPVFIGNPRLCKNFEGLSEDSFVEEMNPEAAASRAVRMCSSGEGDILLKGSVSTSYFLKPVLNSEYGLKDSSLLSHTVLLDVPGRERLLAITDGGMCISPDINEKMLILKNAIHFLHELGIKEPKVGILSAVEKVSPAIDNTIDAAIITKAVERGQIEGCIADGPLAFDLMVSEYACRVKGINSGVCGNVDIILVPEITTGNAVAKAIIHLAGARAAGAILGTSRPVVMLSRADKPETKMNSIALGVILS